MLMEAWCQVLDRMEALKSEDGLVTNGQFDTTRDMSAQER